MTTYLLSLADADATLETVGGKGMSLAKMARAGLPVPGGFHITTAAYRLFVDSNGIQPRILGALQGCEIGDSARVESVSQSIRQLFTGGTIPAELEEAVRAAYRAMAKNGAQTPVAVRSSATAEDLPGASFAGQQDTFLNICGEDGLLDAVKKCWASLWTARAIAYRARQGIEPGSVALAVVVQELVFADVSGVLFTANPVSGRRGEMMITATWGLGEALVGGLVTPDTLVVNKETGRVVSRAIQEKQVMTVRTETGTHEQPVPERRKKAAALNDRQAAALAKLGKEIERLYGMPMDIEWTLTGGNFAIVQARPVTSLPEAPVEWLLPVPKALLARGSFAEFVPDPVSTLFATLAVPISQHETREMLKTFMGVPDEDVKEYIFEVINGYIYVGMVMNPKFLWRMSIVAVLMTKKLLRLSQKRWSAMREKCIDTANRWQMALDDREKMAAVRSVELVRGVREMYRNTAEYYTVAQSGPIPGAQISEISFGRFYKTLVKRKTDPDVPVFLLGGETVPLRAEKSLYDLAMWAKGVPELEAYLLNTETEGICSALLSEPAPEPLAGEFAARLTRHLREFGHCLYDLDFARPVPADDPMPVIEGMKAYMTGNAPSPYERQRQQLERRDKAVQEISARLDPLRRRWFHRLLDWVHTDGPDRENCIADMGLGYPQLRALLRELGGRLARAGAIDSAEDIYWLEARELDALAEKLDAGEGVDSMLEAVERRKQAWQKSRSLHPPVSIPEKSFVSRLLAHDNPEGDTLKGYGASAGKVTARACVMRGPEEFGIMRPGDVIVAVTTTPAWTPLFAIASAVVTDIGGPLSHSSIVAREYGIPAVMATGSATQRIKQGQTITVDGTAGMVRLETGE